MLLYEKTSYTDPNRNYGQVYAVGVRRSKNDTLAIVAEFLDRDLPGYNACNEADRLLAILSP